MFKYVHIIRTYIHACMHAYIQYNTKQNKRKHYITLHYITLHYICTVCGILYSHIPTIPSTQIYQPSGTGKKHADDL